MQSNRAARPHDHPFNAPAAAEWLGGPAPTPPTSPVPTAAPSANPPAALLLTEGDVADRLQVSPRTVQNLRKRGLLRAVNIAGLRCVRFRPADVEAFVASLGGDAQ